MADEFAAIDALVAEYHSRGGQPGLAYGIVRGGRLAHAGGVGERWVGGPAPDADTVFRIASMTKSFTAAAVLLLRDEGALALDDAAHEYVPELRSLRPPADSPAVTIRRLLTMTAGFPTDDPWGDRQQGLPLPEFAAFLARGVSFAWAPGTVFEYSNLGYAILGRVVAAASGCEYAEFVRERLLVPLGMTRTGYHEADFAPGQLARGHCPSGESWAELAAAPYGAFAPMGGVFTCVSDLARWVGGFLAAFPPGEAPAADDHPLRRSSRREMQSPQVTMAPPAAIRLPGDPAGTGPGSYGFGLFIEQDPELGAFVLHGGGYPGFGSIMRWHPGAGLGVIAVANRTYARPATLAARVLETLVREAGGCGESSPRVRGPAPSPAGPWPQTLAARQEVMRLLHDWDDAAADRLFSENVAQDEPFADRRRTIATLRERIGDFTVDECRPAEFDSAAHCRWWLRGEHGVVAAAIALTPERAPRVQSFSLAVPPAPGSPLANAVAVLTAVVNGGDPGALSGLPAAGFLDRRLLGRQLKMAGAWAGGCVPGAFRAGDGEAATTVELDGEHARLILTVMLGRDGVLRQADVAMRA